MKQLNRKWVHFLRSCGFRGPPDEHGFDLSPTLVPVALVADEQDTLPRYWCGFQGGLTAGGNGVVLEVQAVVPIRIRRVSASCIGAAGPLGFMAKAGPIIGAGAAAVTIGSSDGSASRCAARSGQVTPVPPYHGLSIGAGFGVGGVAFDVQQLIPEGMYFAVGTVASVGGTSGTLGLLWEELEQH